MRNAFMALFVLLLILAFALAVESGSVRAADDCTKIRDSAMCLAAPDCHWSGEERSCAPGPMEYVDPCTVHSEKAVCESDSRLRCSWTAKQVCVEASR